MLKRIDKIFFKDKSIPVDLFLDKILYHKKLGYYQKKNPFGKKGDFVTAPNISNVFSEMIAIWFVSFWENLNRPDRINFIELGPGLPVFIFICISYVFLPSSKLYGNQ